MLLTGRWLVLLVLAAPGCWKIEHRSTASSSPIPADLEGRWEGGWRSTTGTPQGPVLIRLQTFGERPVVTVEIDNPCIEPALYRLSLNGTHLELRGGDAVFTAEIDRAQRRLSGTYSCPDDSGTWDAAFTRELAPIGDLSGVWIGGFTSFDPPRSGALSLVLEQEWVGGQLLVHGEIDLEGLPAPVPIADGTVEWIDGRFAVRLFSDLRLLPVLQLVGTGDRDPLRVEGGSMLVLPSPGLQLGSGRWDAVWATR